MPIWNGHESPYVMRERIFRLQHPAPDTIHGYECTYPDGAAPGELRIVQVTVALDPTTRLMVKDAEGIHTGRAWLHLVPFQDHTAPITCRALQWDPYFVTMAQRSAWEAEHPGKEPYLERSEWSNSQPLVPAPILPDPVPEPGLLPGLMIALGVMGIFFARRRKV